MSIGKNQVKQIKSTSLMAESENIDEMAELQRQLEKYQKYCNQHPELYDGIRVDVVISPALLRMHNLYYYFIPFHLLFNISVMINAKSRYCQQSLVNIRSLVENNIAVSTLINH